ncbi:hypothetical protein [Croceicoccus sp. YJ47]|uniref:hypothetical protein n=1 Tax=Croceicoccus sp. YJ47 TaxID=2798724 RepID=UPI001921127C|nr:hypothetical protein [Croceicoccus sp. YJ47]QQN73174.1 hypothetical protein JD971_09865 [Croceicoccus sp. YJ47]
MDPVQYVFRIDAFDPATLPMQRLAAYLSALARMFGHEEHTHFVGIEKGSAKLRAAVDPIDAPKVETRLHGVRIGTAPKDALAAKDQLEDLLANDNAIATLTVGGDDIVVLPFAGRTRKKPLNFPPFREDTSLDGTIVSIGGRDSSAHAILQDGETIHAGITMRRELAKELALLLYGEPVRLYGNGRFERLPDGDWKMSDFKVDRFERLDGNKIADVIIKARKTLGSQLRSADAVKQLLALRGNEEDESE